MSQQTFASGQDQPDDQPDTSIIIFIVIPFEYSWTGVSSLGSLPSLDLSLVRIIDYEHSNIKLSECITTSVKSIVMVIPDNARRINMLRRVIIQVIPSI